MKWVPILPIWVEHLLNNGKLWTYWDPWHHRQRQCRQRRLLESSVASGGADGVLGGRRRRLRSRRGYLLHPLHKVWAKPFPARFASWNAPSIQILDIQSPKVVLSGTLSGSILVRELVCPKVGMSGNLYPRRGLQPVFWIRRLTNASSASSPVRESVFLKIPVRMPEGFMFDCFAPG